MTYTPTTPFVDGDVDTALQASVLNPKFQEVAEYADDLDATMATRVEIVEEAPLNVRDARFGAAMNGVTDDSTAVNDAIDLASTALGGQVLIPRGDCYIGSGITLRSGVDVFGEGKDASALVLADTATNGVSLNANYTSGLGSTLLTTNLTRGDRTAVVTSVTGLAVGDLVLFAGNSIDLGYWVTKITGISTLTLTLEAPAPFTITTAQVATCYRYAWARNVRVADLEIRTNTATPATRIYLMTLYRCEDVLVERCRFKYAAGVGASGIFGSGGRNVTARDCIVENVLAANTAVAFNFEGITGLSVSNPTVRNSSTGVHISGCPHSSLIGGHLFGNSSSGGRGVKVLAGSNHTVVHGVTISGFAATHTGLYLLDSSYCSLTGNTISDTGDGVVLGGNTADRMHHNVVSGNTILNAGIYGIWASLTPAGFDAWCVISSNIINTTANNGIQLGLSSCKVSDNLIQEWTGFGLRIPTSNIKNQIANNHFKRVALGTAILTSTAGNYNHNNTVDTTETITFA